MTRAQRILALAAAGSTFNVKSLAAALGVKDARERNALNAQVQRLTQRGDLAFAGQRHAEGRLLKHYRLAT